MTLYALPKIPKSGALQLLAHQLKMLPIRMLVLPVLILKFMAILWVHVNKNMSLFQDKFDQAIWKVVSEISKGRVMGYGEVARTAGYPRHARMVSKAMSRSDKPLPWHRVVRSNRTLAFIKGSKAYNKQKNLLKKEGTKVINGKVIPAFSDTNKDMDEVLWGSPPPE